MFVYCPEFTHNSHLPSRFVTGINRICVRDYRHPYFSTDFCCLDLDAYESSCSGDNDATMDAAAGIAEYMHNRESSPRHLLVELRFDYQSTRHFDVGNMKRKVAHSIALLQPERVHDEVLFIFKPEVAPQAWNYFKSLSRHDTSLSKWRAMSVSDLDHYLWDKDQLPFEPQNNLEEITRSLCDKYVQGGLEVADRVIKYWLDKMAEYHSHYMLEENDAIARVLLNFLQSLSPDAGSFEDEYVNLRKEDVGMYLKKARP